MKTLVVGWGNPIAGDDAVGLTAAERVAERVDDREDIHVIVTSHGGFRLAERTLGFDAVLVLDAHTRSSADEGVSVLRIDPMQLTLPKALRHDGTLIDAFRALRAFEPDALPKAVTLLSVPIETPTAWSEDLSPAAAAAADRLAQAALRELEAIPIG